MGEAKRGISKKILLGTLFFIVVLVIISLYVLKPTSSDDSDFHSEHPMNDQLKKEQLEREKEIGEDVYKIWAVSSPDSPLGIGQTKNMYFSAMVTGNEDENWNPESIDLWEVDIEGNNIGKIGVLKDDGIWEYENLERQERPRGDFGKGDRIYGGFFNITGESEGTIWFQARLGYQDFTYQSIIYGLSITGFPLGIALSDSEKIIIDESSGVKFYSNEILIYFYEEVSDSRIRAIAREENLEIVGLIPNLRIFQTKFDSDGTMEGLKEKITTLESYTEVEFAEPNVLMGPD